MVDNEFYPLVCLVYFCISGIVKNVLDDMQIVFSGVNLLIGTENGLMLLDRSGQGKGLNYSLFIYY